MRVAILGASPKPERYSSKAQSALMARGYDVVPVRPSVSDVQGVDAVADLNELEPESIHTVTVYVGAQRSTGLLPSFLQLAPKRVIFNPGAENRQLAQELREEGVEVLEACTLVMLSTDQF